VGRALDWLPPVETAVARELAATDGAAEPIEARDRPADDPAVDPPQSLAEAASDAVRVLFLPAMIGTKPMSLVKGRAVEHARRGLLTLKLKSFSRQTTKTS
jgi:hypothetical protein